MLIFSVVSLPQCEGRASKLTFIFDAKSQNSSCPEVDTIIVRTIFHESCFLSETSSSQITLENEYTVVALWHICMPINCTV